MLMAEHFKLRIDQVHGVVQGMRDEIAADRKQAWTLAGAIGGIGFVGGLGALFAIGDWGATPGVLFCGVFLAIVVGAILWTALDRAKRKTAKVDFLADLVDGLKDELHPDKKLDLRFDLRQYDETDKITWSGYSTHGNRKYRYTDKWLRLKVTLADHTEVTIVRQRGLKERKGSLMKEKRRLFLTVNPDMRRYDIYGKNHDRLEKGLEVAALAHFHDPPEDFSAKLGAEVGEFRVKVTQLDAPILPEEVVALVTEMVHYLATKRIDLPA